MPFPRAYRPPRLLLTLILLLTLAGCDLLGGDDADERRLVTTRVLVGNGGNFSDQNGFIMLYDPATGQTAAPSALQLDAFINSLAQHGDRFYALLNTGFSSGRIAVIGFDALEPVAQYSDLGAVRSIAFTDDRAYVTNAGGFVTVLDTQAGAVVRDSIAVGVYPEGIATAAGKVFVANSGSLGAGTTLSVIDPATDQVTGTLDVGCDGPTSLFVDEEDELGVVCSGATVFSEDFSEVIDRTNGQVVFVNPETETVVARVMLDRQTGSANATQGVSYAPSAEEAYVLASDNAVLRIDTDINAQAGQIDVPATPGYVGLTAVAYDAPAERLYLGRFAEGAEGTPDVTSRGTILVLERDGTQAGLFEAGPAPSHILLVQETR